MKNSVSCQRVIVVDVGDSEKINVDLPDDFPQNRTKALMKKIIEYGTDIQSKPGQKLIKITVKLKKEKLKSTKIVVTFDHQTKDQSSRSLKRTPSMTSRTNLSATLTTQSQLDNDTFEVEDEHALNSAQPTGTESRQIIPRATSTLKLNMSDLPTEPSTVIEGEVKRKGSKKTIKQETPIKVLANPQPTPRSINREKSGKTRYKIEVTTSDIWLAGTNDKVEINIIGAQAESEWQTLDNKWKNNFERGQTDEFELVLADLGELKTVQLRKTHGRLTRGNDWQVESVRIVTNGKYESAALFDFRDAQIGKEPVSCPVDVSIEHETPKVNQKPLGDRAVDQKQYNVEVTTSDINFAGTNDRVEINITGAKDESDWQVLDNKWKDDFEQGKTDTFELTLPDLGELKTVTLRKTPLLRVIGDDWQVKSVKIVPAGESPALFEFGDAKITKEGVSQNIANGGVTVETETQLNQKQTENDDQAPKLDYKVQLISSDNKYFMSKGNIEINVTGSKASSGWKQLDNKLFSTTFQQQKGISGLNLKQRLNSLKGQVGKLATDLVTNIDEFVLNMGNVGDLKSVALRNTSSAKYKCHTAKVIIGGKAAVFNFGDDVVGIEGTEKPVEAVETQFHVAITTSDVMWAGTDDDVEINILGDKGETDFQQLDNKGVNDFERGNTDNFELYLPDIGIVTGVILRKSHMLKSNKWQVDKVVVRAATNEGKTFLFDGESITKEGVKRPQDANAATHSAEKEVKVGTDPLTTTTQYKIRLVSADNKFSLSKGQIEINITGSKLRSEWQKLSDDLFTSTWQQQKDIEGVKAMERLEKFIPNVQRLAGDLLSQTDEFVLNLPDLGDLQKVALRTTDETDEDDEWKCRLVKIISGDKASVFNFSEAVITSQGKLKPLTSTETQFKVLVTTSNKWWSGTDDDVEIKILGIIDDMPSDSGWLPLNAVGNNDFEMGNTDEFVLFAEDIGEVSGVELRKLPRQLPVGQSLLSKVPKANELMDDEWRVNNVVVSSSGTTKTFYFDDDSITAKGIKGRSNMTVKKEIKSAEPIVDTSGYKVQLISSDSTYAINDDVEINISGTASTTGWLHLDNAWLSNTISEQKEFAGISAKKRLNALKTKARKFATNLVGDKDEFNLEVSDLGDLEQVQLRKSEGGDWKCDVVKVIYDGKASVFKFGGVNITAEGVIKQRSAIETRMDVAITTSNTFLSGTNNDVDVQIIGSNGSTEWQQLDNKFKNDFEQGETDVFHLSVPDIGDVLGVTLRKQSTESGGDDTWRVDRVLITANGKAKLFEFGGESITDDGVSRPKDIRPVSNIASKPKAKATTPTSKATPTPKATPKQTSAPTPAQRSNFETNKDDDDASDDAFESNATTPVNNPPAETIPEKTSNNQVSRESSPEVPSGGDKIPQLNMKLKSNANNELMNIGKYAKFMTSVNQNDIQQGDLGDCWFLAAMASLAEDEEHQAKRERVINSSYNKEQMANAPDKRQFKFTFFRMGEWHDVFIDGELPKDRRSRPSTDDEWWVPLTEKAYATLNGSYDGIEGGMPAWALTELTGGISARLMISWDKINKMGLAKFKQFVRHYQQNKALFCSGNFGDGTGEGFELNGLISGHAYSLLDFYDIETSKGPVALVKIRNPHGEGSNEWHEEWGDESDAWGNVSEEVKERIGFADRDDGAFFMSLSDWIIEFEQFTICHLALSPTNEQRISGMLKHNVNCATMAKPPQTKMPNVLSCNIQFVMHVTKDEDVWIQTLMDQANQKEDKGLVMLNMYEQDQPQRSRFDFRRAFVDGQFVKPFMPYHEKPFKMLNYCHNGWCYKLKSGSNYFLTVTFALPQSVQGREFMIRVFGSNLKLTKLE